MLSPSVFVPLRQRLTICTFFWLDATSKDSWQYVMWQVKAKSNKKKKPMNLIWNCIWYYIFDRNLIFGEKKIQSALHIWISMDSIEGWKIVGKKKIPWNSKKHNLNLPLIFNYLHSTYIIFGLSWWLRQYRICLQCRRHGLIHGSGRSPGEGNGHPLQYSCLENSMDRGAWWVTVHGVAKSQTWLSD